MQSSEHRWLREQTAGSLHDQAGVMDGAKYGDPAYFIIWDLQYGIDTAQVEINTRYVKRYFMCFVFFFFLLEGSCEY